MSDTVASGELIAVPYVWNQGAPGKNERIFQHLMEHPLWFAGGGSEEERLLNVYWMATDPAVWKWEIWRGGDLLGLILLHRVNPRLDAVFHFTLFDGYSLAGTRRLLKNFLTYAFRAFDLQRISAEVPETAEKYIRFLRSAFGFRYEGELDCSNSALALALASSKVKGVGGAASKEDAAIWLSKIGCRREAAHWDGTKYVDIRLLRLLRKEHLLSELPGDEPRAARDTGSSDVAWIEERTVQPAGPAGHAGAPEPADRLPDVDPETGRVQPAQ